MTAEIICVGTELLLGDILNTNAQFLSRELAELGISVMHQHVIGDNPARLKELVLQAKSRSDLLVFSGGLGPTEDDLTKETVAEAFGDTLAFDEGEWQKIIDFSPGQTDAPRRTTASRPCARRWATSSSTTTARPPARGLRTPTATAPR